MVEVSIDASDVPSEYALTILSECAAFPRRLVFFLKGTLSVGPPRALAPAALTPGQYAVPRAHQEG